MGEFADLVRRTRSVRRFDEERPVDVATLRELLDVARVVPSANNLQPLKYMLIAGDEGIRRVFPYLRWAARLAGWAGPASGERPTGYVIVLGDTAVARGFGCDHGIAAQTLMLAAAERGLAGCIVGSIDRGGLRQALGVPERYEILLVVAVGVPAERVVLEEVGPDGDVAYWRDASDVHHVPKRLLSDVIIDAPTPEAGGRPAARRRRGG